MPYILSERRDKLIVRVPMLGEVVDYQAIECAGDLNFVITYIAKQLLVAKGENYQNYNDILGALEGAKLELYRRQIAPYEDKKIKENGDV